MTRTHPLELHPALSPAALAAAVRAELPPLDRAVAEFWLVEGRQATPEAERVRLYATAAMLDSLTSGIERVLARIAAAYAPATEPRTALVTPDAPEGPSDPPATTASTIAFARAAVLQIETTIDLRRYLAFQHLLRNVHLLDLVPEHLEPLLADARAVWSATREDLIEYARRLEVAAGPPGPTHPPE